MFVWFWFVSRTFLSSHALYICVVATIIMQSLFPSRQSLRHRPCPSSTSSLSSPSYRHSYSSTRVVGWPSSSEYLGCRGRRLVSFSRPHTRLSFRYLHRRCLVPLSFPFSGVLVPRGCLPSTLLFRRSCCDLASVAFHQCCLLWFSGLLLTFAASPPLRGKDPN